jgi:hypothetical protein
MSAKTATTPTALAVVRPAPVRRAGTTSDTRRRVVVSSTKPKGPRLTQRKIDKLRDALHIVRETYQVQAILRMVITIDVILNRLKDLEEGRA